MVTVEAVWCRLEVKHDLHKWFSDGTVGRKIFQDSKKMFLTNVNGVLYGREKSEEKGQLWCYTGDQRLLNDTGLYLTTKSNKEILFASREEGSIGQIWSVDHQDATFQSKLLKDYKIVLPMSDSTRSRLRQDVLTLSLIRGNNEMIRAVSNPPGLMDLKSKNPVIDYISNKPLALQVQNKRNNLSIWFHKDNGQNVECPECVDIKYDLSNITFSKESPQLETVVETTDRNETDSTDYKATLTWTKQDQTTTTRAHEFDANLSSTVTAGFSGESGVPFVAKGKVSGSVSLTAEVGYAFKNAKAVAATNSMAFTRTFSVPPHQTVRFRMVATKVECSIPYTCVYNDGSRVSDSLTHTDSLNVQFHAEQLSQL